MDGQFLAKTKQNWHREWKFRRKILKNPLIKSSKSDIIQHKMFVLCHLYFWMKKL